MLKHTSDEPGLSELTWHMDRTFVDECQRIGRYANGDRGGISRYLLRPDARYGWVVQFVSDVDQRPWAKEHLGAYRTRKDARWAATVHARGRGRIHA